ncbi:hypothetical protein MBH78_23465 [Oceanimonas sp. NS1]|nr:hypothetical protein [Oceanimonas sp. NS1]
MRRFCPAPAEVGILGGGIAGATVALRLTDMGINTLLLESGTGLVNGPPSATTCMPEATSTGKSATSSA